MLSVETRSVLRKTQKDKTYQFRYLRPLVLHTMKSGQRSEYQREAGDKVDPSSAKTKFIDINACPWSSSPGFSNWVALESGHNCGSTVVCHYGECGDMNDDAGITNDAYICTLE